MADVGTIETEGGEIDGVNLGHCTDGLDWDGLRYTTACEQDANADGDCQEE